ncbi:hypothetical protein [Klebsiella sp. S1]|uniref:hypothetical protein n=1 Tax=Klebsiella pneumoniae TaxID=573 RepID=UPI000840B425
MTRKLTREERVQALYDLKVGQVLSLADIENVKMLARMALAAMDSETVEMPLDYLQGHKDGLEWAAQLAEANHPETGDWLYDDPIELAKAIRKGQDMSPVQPVADSEPVAWIAQNKNTGEVEIDEPFAKATNPKYWTDSFPVYRHAQLPVVPEGYKLVPTELTSEMVKAFRSFCEAYDDDLIAGYKAMLEYSPQPAPVVPEEMTPEMMRSVQLNSELGAYAASNLSGAYDLFAEFWKEACRAAMLIGGKP